MRNPSVDGIDSLTDKEQLVTYDLTKQSIKKPLKSILNVDRNLISLINDIVVVSNIAEIEATKINTQEQVKHIAYILSQPRIEDETKKIEHSTAMFCQKLGTNQY